MTDADNKPEWEQDGWPSEVDYLSHVNCELLQDRAMLSQALRGLLANPTDEAKEFARLALGDRSHG
jgi:hypothetical protein